MSKVRVDTLSTLDDQFHVDVLDLIHAREYIGEIQSQGSSTWSLLNAPYPVNAQVFWDNKQWIALRETSVEPGEGEDWSCPLNMADASSGAIPETLAKRDENNTFKVGAPTDPAHPVTKHYVDNYSDIGAITSYSQISGTNSIEGVELTNNIHDVFGDGSAIATYQLDSDANDLGGTYDGVETNVTYEEGKFGQAAKLVADWSNGRSVQSVTSGFSTPASLVTNKTELTISMWVKSSDPIKPTILTGMDYRDRRLFSAKIIKTDAADYFAHGAAPIANTFRMYSGGDANVDINLTTPYIMPLDTWIHFAIVFNGAERSWKVYVNNQLLSTFTDTRFTITGLSNPLDKFYIGSFGYTNVTSGDNFDQVRLFNRVLTQEEINTLYLEYRLTEDISLNINQGTFVYPKGLAPKGYVKSSDTFTGTVPISGASDGWKYIAKDENNNFSFYNTKPTLGKTSAELYLKDGKLHKSSDDTEITPISFLSNKVRFESGSPIELAPSGVAKSVTDSIEVNKLIMNGMEAFACRAWVNFDGTGTVAIRASGNVSSITDNGVGDYTVNFTTAMPDANYSYSGGAKRSVGNFHQLVVSEHLAGDRTTSLLRVNTGTTGSVVAVGTPADSSNVNVAIFR